MLSPEAHDKLLLYFHLRSDLKSSNTKLRTTKKTANPEHRSGGGYETGLGCTCAYPLSLVSEERGKK